MAIEVISSSSKSYISKCHIGSNGCFRPIYTVIVWITEIPQSITCMGRGAANKSAGQKTAQYQRYGSGYRNYSLNFILPVVQHFYFNFVFVFRLEMFETIQF